MTMMNNFVDPSGLRIGIPNPETDEEFKERLRNYVFNYICQKYKKNEVVTYDEVVEQYNSAHPNRRLEQTTELEFDFGLITGENESELKLTEKGIERCRQQN
jgi:hypothetical protein